ncbi:Hypothetical protein SMAX5B_022465 [Scophthalmus maximus]|uniref:Uncharacterized protein n=1 Tax=Scophthalmus maximus TaxID=52904 RepID=A0A2U9C2U9_SCOMX|nr:Hypothetical protein SMAX5B_022465 [Scophthalmus maximus]
MCLQTRGGALQNDAADHMVSAKPRNDERPGAEEIVLMLANLVPTFVDQLRNVCLTTKDYEATVVKSPLLLRHVIFADRCFGHVGDNTSDMLVTMLPSEMLALTAHWSQCRQQRKETEERAESPRLNLERRGDILEDPENSTTATTTLKWNES